MTMMIDDLPQINLTTAEAWALAQYLRRLRWDVIRICAVNDDEAEQMEVALGKIQAAVAGIGVEVR